MDWLLQVQTAHTHLQQRACSTPQEKAACVVHNHTAKDHSYGLGHRHHQGLCEGGRFH